MLSEEDDLFKEDDEKVINESNVQLIKPNILLTVTSDQDKTLHHFNNIIKEKN